MDKLTRKFGPVIAKIEIRASGNAILHYVSVLKPDVTIGNITEGMAREWNDNFAAKGAYRPEPPR